MAPITKPDFLGIGAQKAGTSWLFEWLHTHPEVFMPAEKEIHFWDTHETKGYKWYEGLFQPAASAQKKGEITPAYAILSSDKVKEIRDYAPALRIFYSLRNPIDRAWSHARMTALQEGLDPQTLSDKWFIAHFNSEDSLLRGDYETCLKTWLIHFKPAQFLTFLFDEIATRPEEVLTTVAGHLTISKAPYENASLSALMRPVLKSTDPLALRTTLAPVLKELYAPKISRLENFLGVSLTHWIEKHE
ncbi:MAG: sulfotransferase domain-containing protein [Alphaproteobacteria bacterium]